MELHVYSASVAERGCGCRNNRGCLVSGLFGAGASFQSDLFDTQQAGKFLEEGNKSRLHLL